MKQLIGIVAALALIGGCTQSPPARTARVRVTATISHVVFVQLEDAADTAEFIADCDRLLPEIESVTTYACGEHIDTGRESVLSDYHVGIYVGFDDVAGYEAYVVDPKHVELVEKWEPRLASISVRDVLDETP